jgi:hypothetical protein
MNNSHYPESYLFYALIITLAPTLIQCNQIIAENSTQWTTRLINNLIESPKPLPTDQHKLLKFHLENLHIIKPRKYPKRTIYIHNHCTTRLSNYTT